MARIHFHSIDVIPSMYTFIEPKPKPHLHSRRTLSPFTQFIDIDLLTSFSRLNLSVSMSDVHTSSPWPKVAFGVGIIFGRIANIGREEERGYTKCSKFLWYAARRRRGWWGLSENIWNLIKTSPLPWNLKTSNNFLLVMVEMFAFTWWWSFKFWLSSFFAWPCYLIYSSRIEGMCSLRHETWNFRVVPSSTLGRLAGDIKITATRHKTRAIKWDFLRYFSPYRYWRVSILIPIISCSVGVWVGKSQWPRRREIWDMMAAHQNLRNLHVWGEMKNCKQKSPS